jgi:hypothetical protein
MHSLRLSSLAGLAVSAALAGYDTSAHQRRDRGKAHPAPASRSASDRDQPRLLASLALEQGDVGAVLGQCR